MKLFGRNRIASGILALLSIAAIAPAQGKEVSADVKKEVLEKVTYQLTTHAYVPGIDFTKWPGFIEQHKKEIDDAKTEEEFQRAVNIALSDFGASHIVMTTPRQSETRRTGATVGIGISAQSTPDGLTIVRVIKDAPAERAGLLPGDVIVEVDGKPAEGTKGIAGEEGTKVKIKIKRPDGTTKELEIARHKFSTIRKEELVWIDKETARLAVYTFDLSYDRENVESLMREAKSAKNLIVDLRDNGGGAVVNLEHLLGLLMNPEQPIGTFISKRTVNEYKAATDGKDTDLEAIASWTSKNKVRPQANRRLAPFKGSLTVLVNAFSGSASEIAAAALQETQGAKVIGTKSAGAVLVSVIVPAANDYMIQYPVSDYVTIRGRRLEGNGVIPDIEAKDPQIRLPNAKDAVIEAALSLLAKSKDPSGKGSGQ
ncbi:MAG TPA: S41 family peptidase [Fimbriimonas sp.]|nr:S41 family peptidase [Fimbriimonas sp.]